MADECMGKIFAIGSIDLPRDPELALFYFERSKKSNHVKDPENIPLEQ